MEDDIKFPETVFLIDGDFLNHVHTDIRKHFSKKLNRELPDINLDELLTFLSLDSFIKDGDREIMVILVHDTNTVKLEHCQPSDFKTELNNVAFKNSLGEFQFTSISTEGFVSREDLFLNVLELITTSDDAKKVILIPFEDEYINETLAALEDSKKEVIFFGMNNSPKTKKHQWEILAFPLMQALGIRGDEI